MRPRRPLADALGTPPAPGFRVLDGGLSRELAARGHDLSGALWTARLLRDDPAAITAAHTACVRAGAQVVITASYQASHEGFGRAGADRREAGALFARAVELARAAADAAPQEVWVAASVGPYGAVRADGGEYRGRYGLSVRALERFHRPRIEALAAAGPDVLALETVPDRDEAEALLRAAEGCGIPLWLSYTVSGGRTRAGQPLADAYAPLAGRDQVIAAGANCCAPEDAGAAVAAAVGATGLPAVVYPNSGERWDATAREYTGPVRYGPARAPGWAREWAAAGARLIGGCCRVGSDTVAALARAGSGAGRQP
ncbi:homocysteine S-methyltransferase [Streptomyces sp. NPDC000594]|uniref:homocysteine S-methyltransferase n=1 Tax=Streptomyces sp. NPDC000594 TaxID=3154261 RepID=UPI00332926E9